MMSVCHLMCLYPGLLVVSVSVVGVVGVASLSVQQVGGRIVGSSNNDRFKL